MKVAITGGTGFIGSHTVAAARAGGYEVRMLVRDPDKVQRVRTMFGLLDDPGIEAVRADLSDPASVASAIEGCDAVIHVAALFTLDPTYAEEMHRVNPEMTRTVIDAARAAGLDPIVDVSTLGVYQPPPASFVTAEMDLAEGCGPYTRSKIAAEHVARAAQDEGAPVVTIYPGGVFGPRDPNPGLSDSVKVVRDVLLWRLPTLPAHAAMPFVDVRDVAELCVAALEPGRGPRRYLFPGDPVELRGIVTAMSELTGRRLPKFPAPRSALAAAAAVADSVGRRVRVGLPISSETIELIIVGIDHPDARYDDSPAREQFGLPARTLEETLVDTMRWLAEAGYVAPKRIGRLARA